MKFHIREKVFSWRDTFHIYNEHHEMQYYVKGEFIHIGRKLHVYDPDDHQVSYIHEHVLAFFPTHEFNIDHKSYKVVKRISFFRPKYKVKGLGWEVEGDILKHNFTIRKGREVIARITDEWLTWGHTYAIDVKKEENAIYALSVVLILDGMKHKEEENEHKEMSDKE
ncbi:MAG: LURP-one-related family protein [Firmicutes bacterium]|nr:LURP-one-related family protein [Bacillota bacterium]